jgi:hypothetical protein
MFGPTFTVGELRRQTANRKTATPPSGRLSNTIPLTSANFGTSRPFPACIKYLNDLIVYPAYFKTRKRAGSMTRKLSEIESHRVRQFFGTPWMRKVITFALKAPKVG